MADAFIIGLAKRGSKRSGGALGPDLADDSPDGKTPDQGDEPDGRDDNAAEPKDKYSDVTQSALDDLAKILGVNDSDRGNFDSAMEDLCEACAKRAVSEESDA